MNIVYDHQIFSLQTYGGISRYFSELIHGINNSTPHTAQLSLSYTNNVYAHDLSISNRSFLRDRNFPRKMPLLYNINKLSSSFDLLTKPYDLVHATYYDPYILPLLKGRPFVITFLDMIHEKFGSQFTRELAYDGTITKQKRLVANRADCIIAISESTKRDIVDLLDINPNKISVVYLGNSLLSPSEPASSAVTSPYLLFVGNRSMYKNFTGLLKAIHPLLKQYNIKLLCAGGGTFTKEEKEFIQSLNAVNFVGQQSFNDQTLPLLYQNALAFIFPTLYEGFGIPILEAFACSCPCIVSDVSSLPEVAGQAALYIDPTMPESITHAIEQLIGDPTLRETLIQKGREQLAKFSWHRTITETVNIYQSVA
jgi:glycosyltransferase involved in cell wall biosynthesis